MTLSPAYYQKQDETFWEKAMEEKGSPTKARKEQFAKLWANVDKVVSTNPDYYKNPNLRFQRKYEPCVDVTFPTMEKSQEQSSTQSPTSESDTPAS